MLLLNMLISLIKFLLLNVAFYLSRIFDPVISLRVDCICNMNVREIMRMRVRERRVKRESNRERGAKNESV